MKVFYQHSEVIMASTDQTGATDRAGPLYRDLKQRGIAQKVHACALGRLFGRTPMSKHSRRRAQSFFFFFFFFFGPRIITQASRVAGRVSALAGLTMGETDEFGFQGHQKKSPRPRSARDMAAPPRFESH